MHDTYMNKINVIMGGIYMNIIYMNSVNSCNGRHIFCLKNFYPICVLKRFVCTLNVTMIFLLTS